MTFARVSLTALMFTLAAVVVSPNDIQAGDLVGMDGDIIDTVSTGLLEWPAHAAVQHWTLVDNHNPKAIVTGVVTEIKKQPKDAINDGDWNIKIRPDASSAALLKNSRPSTNSDGLIELSLRGRLCFSGVPYVVDPSHAVAGNDRL